MILALVVLLPTLAGFALIAAAPDRRGELALAAGFILGATLALAVAAILTGDTLLIVWGSGIELAGRLTPLSAIMLILPPLVALPVVVRGALTEEGPGLPRMVGLLLVFVGGMELVVIADDLVTLLVGWEVIGAASWALVAHRWRDPDAVTSGIWAFVVTRTGDLGLFLALMATVAATGSTRLNALGELTGMPLLLVSAGLLVSAAAKAAQAPFSPWLFRAMDGPTPVSALLHSATLVAAGAYLVLRAGPMLGDGFGAGAMAVGATTAVAGGIVALLNLHAKRLLAGSTSAHLGLMFVAAGAGYPGVALAHLVTHAAMKSALFIEAGTAHELRGTYALDRLAIGRAVPVLTWMTLLPTLALAGIPPLGAAWSKEKIAGAAHDASTLATIAVVVGGALSAAYAMRFYVAVFSPGPDVDPGRIPSRAVLILPSAFLAVVTLALSVLWIPAVPNTIADRLGVALPPGSLGLFAASIAAIAAGAVLGIVIARRRADLGRNDTAAALGDWLGLPWLLENAVARPAVALARVLARIDDVLVDRGVHLGAALSRTIAHVLARIDDTVVDRGVRLVAALSRWLANAGDRFGERTTDGLPRLTAYLVGAAGGGVRRTQTGLSHHYFAILVAGLAVAVAVLSYGA